MLTVAYGEATLDRSNVYRWYKMFSEGGEDVNDEERAGRPSTSTTNEKINEVEKMILANRRITVKEVAEDLNISIGSCHSIFIDDLGMRRVAVKFVPKLLNCDQKQHRMNIANEMLDSVRDDPNLLQRVITGDEAWVYGYDVETKAQSSQWKLPHEPRPKKARQVRSNVKVLLTVFFDCRGMVHHEFLPQGRTVNKEYYLQVMRNLREAIRQKRPDFPDEKGGKGAEYRMYSMLGAAGCTWCLFLMSEAAISFGVKDSEILTKLNFEANQYIKAIKKSIDDLRLFAKEQVKSQEGQTILTQADDYQAYLAKNQGLLKNSILYAQMAINKQNQQQLLTCENSTRQRMRNQSLVSTASGISDNLLHISRTMASQVKQSENTLHTLLNSSSLVTDTREELKGMGTNILNSKKLLTKYNRRELTDKVLLFIAFVFFFACVLYIVKRRLF
ncbi:hypothetical protein LAZ67_1002852 [Cordylochernes scorpioides]|uniref:Sec20 C-terminal domain-containing protein n=1 Tax=Cordylochernes scorpioides TaxID=51811 RepID=A0ABY6JXS8_9ARAC|nr:hypothetical protein LAZ67_1002852 [Cordylochernes scorpioides]